MFLHVSKYLLTQRLASLDIAIRLKAKCKRRQCLTFLRSLRANHVFSGAYVELRKATFSFVVSVRLSVRPSVRPFSWDISASSSTGRVLVKLEI